MTRIKKQSLKILGEKGQSLFEFIFFLPFIIVMIFVTVGVGNAINASINQQKVVRGYFFARVKNSSEVPLREDVYRSLSTIGMFYIGWRERFADNSNSPLQPCFRFNIPGLDDENQRCDSSYSRLRTGLIKVGTVFGICGKTLRRLDGGFYSADTLSPSMVSNRREGCLIQ